MLYIHTIGRIGKDCQVIEGTHGSFIAFDMAVDDFSHGNAVTTCRGNIVNFTVEGQKRRQPDPALHHGGCPGVHQYR